VRADLRFSPACDGLEDVGHSPSGTRLAYGREDGPGKAGDHRSPARAGPGRNRNRTMHHDGLRPGSGSRMLRFRAPDESSGMMRGFANGFSGGSREARRWQVGARFLLSRASPPGTLISAIDVKRNCHEEFMCDQFEPMCAVRRSPAECRLLSALRGILLFLGVLPAPPRPALTGFQQPFHLSERLPGN
jgi:hypothetical protein